MSLVESLEAGHLLIAALEIEVRKVLRVRVYSPAIETALYSNLSSQTTKLYVSISK